MDECIHHLKVYFIVIVLLLISSGSNAQQNTRQQILLNTNWQTIANDSSQKAFDGFEKNDFNVSGWKQVTIPHNWDAYEGYRRKLHGNRHGYAWYRKKVDLPKKIAGKRYFLWFEGVGSYATVWLNGKKVGKHAGGRTSFTIDVTEVINAGTENILAVRADHPAGITNLPWVCGGCSSERGFSEGSQPMGIFRPVHLVIANEIRIEPFGIHAWNDTTVSPKKAQVYFTTTIKNYSDKDRTVEVVTSMLTHNKKIVAITSFQQKINASSLADVTQNIFLKNNVRLWSLEDPYLYRIVSVIKEKGKTIDSVVTPYGIRWISWPVGKPASTNQFYLNGKPVFINGIAEYEHLIGNSHAFSDEQIRARALQVKAIGFNAFRDGHQPHNLLYQRYWDELGMLWWTQLSAHVWYDTPEFRKNFKQLLREWVLERRNSPSVVLWGLQNESKLPADFAKECTELIRSLDPTASTQRKVTTCNGGEGTDWDVPQNWTGTYGGDPATYAADVKRQVLIGEYGAWRTLDLHTEGAFKQNGPLSEDRMTQLMEQKIRLGESAKDSSSGHFFWLYTSHDNPGRVQGGEGLRELDRIGPVNYKGLLTPWEEPLDVCHMFRSNYAKKEIAPMVYIVSHTWPQRWTMPGIKDSIIIYSNCDEVELFNDVNNSSLGKRKRKGIGTHFQWDGVNIQFNVLSAVGYVNGKAVAKDRVILQHLPKSPRFDELYKDAQPIIKAEPGYNYLYRVNCGGAAYVDENKNTWLADEKKRSNTTWGSGSWTDGFNNMPAFFASQRQTWDAITNSKDWPLFQSFRYGREQLKYEFDLQDGEYLVELYFVEPWWGTGGGMDCTGYRLFDVALSGLTVLKDLDIWKEAGHDAVLKKTFKVAIGGGKLTISFPQVKVGQAVISAIAIASLKKNIQPALPSLSLIENIQANKEGHWQQRSWLNIGDALFINGKQKITSLPSNLYGAEWMSTPNTDLHEDALFKIAVTSDVFICLKDGSEKPTWMADYGDTKNSITTTEASYRLYRKRYAAGDVLQLKNIAGQKGYCVIINEASSMEPAYDLKPVTTYKAADALLTGNLVKKDAVNSKPQAVFVSNESASVIWDIAVGVADEYSITLKYNLPTEKNIEGWLTLSLADGTLMKKEKVILVNTKSGKWNYVSTSSGGMINAGNYKVQLTAKGAEGLVISSIDVQ